MVKGEHSNALNTAVKYDYNDADAVGVDDNDDDDDVDDDNSANDEDDDDDDDDDNGVDNGDDYVDDDDIYNENYDDDGVDDSAYLVQHIPHTTIISPCFDKSIQCCLLAPPVCVNLHETTFRIPP